MQQVRQQMSNKSMKYIHWCVLLAAQEPWCEVPINHPDPDGAKIFSCIRGHRLRPLRVISNSKRIYALLEADATHLHALASTHTAQTTQPLGARPGPQGMPEVSVRTRECCRLQACLCGRRDRAVHIWGSVAAQETKQPNRCERACM